MNAIFLFGMPGGSELLVVAALVLLLFGGKKIPELMKGLGKGIREFNAAKSNIKDELEQGMKEEKPEKVSPKEDQTS